MNKIDKIQALKLFSLALAGIGFFVSQKLEENQLEARIDKALDERGIPASETDQQ